MKCTTFLAFLSIMLPLTMGRTLDLKYLSAVTAEMICVNKPADIVFILDESSSIYYKDFYSQVNFVMGLAPRFNLDAGDIKIGILSFSDTTNIRFHLGSVPTMDDMEVEMQKINSSQRYGDQTLTFNAIDEVVEKMFVPPYVRSNVPRILVLITDGESSDFDKTSAAADRARDAGIVLFAIGVGKNLQRELKAIANDPDEDFVFEVKNFNALEDISKKLVQRTCTIITTTPPPSIEGCDAKGLVDVIFSLPDHAGITGTEYAIEFVNSFVARSHQGSVRVGVTPRLCYAMDGIPLDTLNTAGFVMALNQRKYTQADIHIHIQNIAEGMTGNEEAVKFGILIVDSRFSNQREAMKWADKARLNNIHLVAIGVGAHVDSDELLAITGSADSVVIIQDYSLLQEEVELIVDQFCEEMGETETYTDDYDYSK